MNTKNLTSMFHSTAGKLACAVLLTASLGACGDDAGSDDGNNGSSTGGTTNVDSSGEPPPADSTTTDDPTGGTTAATDGSDSGSSGDTGTPEVEYPDADFGDYARIDRAGMPAVNTVLITSKDDYNQASLTDDVDGMFVPEIVAALTGLHEALDDDLIGLKLTPCAIKSCVAVGGPLILPDTLKIDTEMDSGFPNGRRLADPVIDVTLAVLLLDIAGGNHTPLDLVGVNPTENDVAFDTSFPYLAEPH